MDVRALLRPQSVALVGANEKMTFGGHAARNLTACADRIDLYFVNPNRDEVYGRKCYNSITELPKVVDCVVIAIPKQGVNEVLEQAGSMGVKAAVIFASGYTEEHSEEGRELDKKLREIATRYDMAVTGPNSMGVTNNVDHINLMGLGTPDELDRREAKVAIVSHSGALSGALTRRGAFPMAYQISVGNGSVTAMEDYVEYLAGEEAVKVIALYMEGVRKPPVMLRALKKAAMNHKPVVVLKTGRGAIAAASAASHTGSLAGSFASYQAIFKKYGVISVDTLEELICTSYMMAVLDGNYPKKPTIAGFNLSGGANILMAEAADKAGVVFPKFTDEICTRLREFVPGFSTPANPLDATTDLFYKQQNIIEILRVMDDDDEVGAIVTGQDMGPERSATSDIFINGLIDAKVKYGVKKPILFAGLTEQERNLECRKMLEDAGIPVLASMEPSMKSVRYLMDYIQYDAAEHDLRIPDVSGAPATETIALSERESKAELAELGIPFPKQALVTDAKDFSALDALRYPIVAKISSPDILHKTDVGGVKLNIQDRAEAEKAFGEIMDACKKKCPDAQLIGIDYQEMAASGTEFIIGVTNDPQLGPMVLVGMGGVFVEVFKDAQLAPAPLSEKEALNMVESLKAYKLLTGYRGQAKKDVNALVKALVQVSEYAYAHCAQLKEMDLNPVFVYDEGKGICAVDALVVKKK